MKIKGLSPDVQLSGSWTGSDLVYAHNSFTGTTYAYGKAERKDPRTYDQELSRDVGREAVTQWSRLTSAQRGDWDRFASLLGSMRQRRRGYDVCREAARMRLMLGLEPRCDAPRLAFPAPVTDVSLEPSIDPDEFMFRIEHGAESPAACVVLVKITPQTRSCSRKPLIRDARAIRGFGAQSATPLPESGGTVMLTGARFRVEAGGRFGAAMTVIRVEDGLASSTTFYDLVRPSEADAAGVALELSGGSN